MSIDLASFTPVRSLAGGLLIGLASAVLYAGAGRIAGISGIAAGLLPRSPSDERAWRALFTVGLLATSALIAGFAPSMFSSPTASLATVVLGGLLVGVGTRLANGCTSGHGVCGLSRRSPRSLASVLTFMFCAGVTVLLTAPHGAAR